MSDIDQTIKSFRDKWTNNPNLAFTETLREGSEIFNWLLTRNGLATPDAFRGWLAPRRRILDAGCGNGRVTALLRRYAAPEAEIVGIDISAADIARENLKETPRVTFFTKDLLGDLTDLGTFDLIYCQEVLHHTSDPQRAFLNLCRQLTPSGEIAIYVYKLKAPLREHADDYIRERIAHLDYEAAMQSMRGLTELGRLLAELKVTVKMPAVDVIGLEAGEYDVQRLVYNVLLKCFWNPELSFEDNVAINYDWYHPQLCSRHTLPEVEAWFERAGLRVLHRCVDPYGITVRGQRA